MPWSTRLQADFVLRTKTYPQRANTREAARKVFRIKPDARTDGRPSRERDSRVEGRDKAENKTMPAASEGGSTAGPVASAGIGKSADKPGSVDRARPKPDTAGSHSSWRRVAPALQQPTRGLGEQRRRPPICVYSILCTPILIDYHPSTLHTRHIRPTLRRHTLACRWSLS
jgi:hypothetical protein